MWLLIQMKRPLDRFVDLCVTVLMAALALVVFVAVITRYFLNYPLAWSEEVSRYSFVWLSFLGAEVCLRGNSHIGVDLFVKYLPPNIQQSLQKGGRLLIGFTLFAVLIAGIQITAVAHDQQSPALGIPMSYVYLAVPVGAALMLLELLVQAFSRRGITAS